MSEIRYANMSEVQIERLKEIEKGFNDEFSTEFYLMAMEDDK